MILGISGSGRPNGNTANAVKKVLESSNEEYEYISLAGKKINGCIGCTGCAENNKCIIYDDFNEIAEKMIKADAIVFGAPNYYGMMNGLSHCFWERCFCFRHRSAFKLSGKLGIIVTTGYNNSPLNDDPVQKAIKSFMVSNKMAIINQFSIPGYSQCYTCGYGVGCTAGNIVGTHGLITELEDSHYPQTFNNQPNEVIKAVKCGMMLGSILKDRQK